MTKEKRYIGQITDKDVFLSIMEELRYKNRDNHYNEYDILKSCGLVRQLILDGSKSLFHKINRQTKLKLKFKVINHKDSTFEGNFCYKNIYPNQQIETIELTIDEFFKKPIISKDNIVFSVKELILYGANVGGVHSITFEKGTNDYILQNMRGIINEEGISKFLAMQNICFVVLDSLTPLENVIKKVHQGV
jgi:hypothetical protein